MNVDPKKVSDVVKQVLSEVLKNENLAQVARSPQARSPHSSSHPSGSATIESPEKLQDKRKYAKENIARWLGGAEPSYKGSRTTDRPSQKFESFKLQPLPAKEVLVPHKKKQPEGDIDSETPIDRNFIPNPKKPENLDRLLDKTPARIGVWRAGTRYLTKVALKLRADHAVAKDAVYAELKPGFAEAHGWIPLETKTKTKEEFLLRPDLGRELDEKSLQIVKEKGIKNPDIQITVADGLSAWAAERYGVPMVQELQKVFKDAGYSVGTIFCVKYSRIAIQDVIGEAVGAKVSLILLGERPGLGTGDSLSNYMVYGPKVGIVNAKKSMISNIHNYGYPPEAAAKLTLQMVQAMFEQKCSGVDLKV